MSSKLTVRNSTTLTVKTGDRLRLLRAARNMTQRELSKRSGYSNAAISDVELSKRDARDTTMQALAGALEVPPEALTDDLECIAQIARITEVPWPPALGPSDVATASLFDDIVRVAVRELGLDQARALGLELARLSPQRQADLVLMLRALTRWVIEPSVPKRTEESARDAPQPEPSPDQPAPGEGGQ